MAKNILRKILKVLMACSILLTIYAILPREDYINNKNTDVKKESKNFSLIKGVKNNGNKN